jgi:deazaflavin-dependent oxidoreductase (nitroreductase family)
VSGHPQRRYRLGRTRRTLNVLVKGLARLGLAPPHVYMLAVRGRRSGRVYATPVRLIEAGGRRWLVAPYGERDWVKNARAAGEIELRRGRRRERLRVRELPPADRAFILRQYARAVRVTRPFFAAGPADDLAAFAAEADRHPVFELEPAAPDQRSPAAP